MSGFLCSMVGASFTVAAVAQVLRSKKGITAVGNAQVDTAQSKFGGASALFDGTGDYLTVGNAVDSDLALTGTTWTVEYWARINSHTGSFNNTIGIWDSTTAVGAVYYFTSNAYNGTQKMGFSYVYGTNSLSGDLNFGSALSTGVWQHHAFVRNGNTLTAYLDGVSQGTHDMTGRTIDITGYNNSSTTPLKLTIGAMNDVTGAYNGWLDEIRISNTARYTANFTAPTAPFQNDANTLLLLHMDGTDASTFFEDDNGVRASRSLIAQGNAQIDTAQSKFGGSALLCDGTGDYVMSPQGTQWDFGTSSFTIEYWIRFNVAPTLYVPIALRTSASILNGEWWCEITNAEKKMYWGFKNQAGTQFYVNLALAGTAFATGQWYHIALVNNAGTAQMYVNGTATGTSTALSGSFGISTTDLWVGAGAGGFSLNGWLDEVRISNTARYTAGFTAPTTPFVNDTNTLLLIHADGTDASTVFRDDNGQGRSAVGVGTDGTGAAVSTTQSKFGGSSLRLSYSGSTWDYLQITQPSSLLNFGTGDWTVEGWFRFDDTNTDLAIWTGGTTTGDLDIRRTNDNLLRIGRVNTAWDVISGSTGISANTWYHIAFVKGGGTARIYVNGTQVGTASNSISYSIATQLRIGAQSTSSLGMSGYIDELRASNIARYTAAFTAPTAPFQSDANTLLLLHMDGTDASTVFTDDNGIAPYTI